MARIECSNFVRVLVKVIKSEAIDSFVQQSPKNFAHRCK